MPNRENSKPGLHRFIHERRLAEELGSEIAYPIRGFTLDSLDIETDTFVRDLEPSFADLPWDHYDLKREQTQALLTNCVGEEWRINAFFQDYYSGSATLDDVRDLIDKLPAGEKEKFDKLKPARRRAISKFVLLDEGLSNWGIQRVPVRGFHQQVSDQDVRSLERKFEEMDPTVTCHRFFRRLLSGLARMVRDVEAGAGGMEITVHQVATYAYPDKPGDNAPEGIHQDGADYIVSALVLKRQGVSGGESIIYGPDMKTEYLRTILDVGEGLFHADRNTSLWHDVTLIHNDPTTGCSIGERQILGFDINTNL